MDGDQFHFVEDFIIYKEKNTDPAWEINLHIITNNRGKIRIDSTQNGLLSWSLSEIFNQNKTLSSDMLKTQTETYLAEKGMFWSVKSYAIGYPFLLYNTRMEEKVNNPDNRTRGAAVEYIEENTLAENKEKPSGSYALVFGINEYKYWNSLKIPSTMRVPFIKYYLKNMALKAGLFAMQLLLKWRHPLEVSKI